MCVLKAIEKLSDSVCEIKWVNDIRINSKKVCGILAENIFDVKTRKTFTVLGIGVNVTGNNFPEELKNIASSIEKETGKIISIDSLASEIVNCLGKYDFSDYMEKYREKSCVINKTVKVISPQGEYFAKALDITDSGKLLIETNGKTKELFSGDVSILI